MAYKTHVYVLVKIDMVEDADIQEVIQEMDYSFSHGDDITGTEIIGIERVKYSGKVIKA